jgi:DNA repair protein RadC
MNSATKTLRELTIRYTRKKDAAGRPLVIGKKFTSPHEAANVLSQFFLDESIEVFALLCLTAAHDVIAYHEVSRGCLDTTTVHPREVFKAAILANAAALVLAHNHPSGHPEPSRDDHHLTKRLAAAGQLLGIEVLDHIIITDGGFFSFRQAGLL